MNPFENKKFTKTKMNMESFRCGIYSRKAQPFLFKKGDRFYIYYEKYDNNMKWEIGVLTTDILNFPNGNWIHFPSILCKSNINNYPDNGSIADPCVIYYNDEYHMWFDMLKSGETWTLGHATSNDGLHWKKQQTKNKTDILLDVGKKGEWDDGLVHAPEIFLYNNQMKFIYNATNRETERYSAGMMELSDPTSLNSHFIKLGRITHPDIISIGNAGRLYAPFWYKENLYTVLSSLGKENKINNPTDYFFMISENGGMNWKEICRVPGNLALHSFLTYGNKLWACCQTDQYLYYLEE